MNSIKNNEESISVNREAMLEFLLKTVLVCVVIFLPIIVLVLVQDTLYGLFGPLDPISVPYLTTVGVIIIWYFLGFALLFPRLGIRIENYSRRKHQ